MQITADEFKAKCLSLIDQVHDSGEPVLITKDGRVIASLVPEEDVGQKPWLKLRGSVRRFDGPLKPVDENEVEALK